MRMGLISILISLILLFACEDQNTEESVDIRLFNSSEVCVHDIRFNPGDRTADFGSLATNTYSIYQTFDYAYPVPFISLRVDNDTLTIQPIDYVGENKLRGGSYTFTIFVDTSQNIIRSSYRAD